MAHEPNLVAKFVSQKINKIRWQPIPKQSVHQSTVFATGSWDDIVNKVCVWSVDNPQQHGTVSEEQMDTFLAGEPTLMCEREISGDVTDLTFANQEMILAASSSGSVFLLKLHSNNTLSMCHSWEHIHHLPLTGCSCTSIACKGDDTFVSVGEDGRLCVINMEQRQPIQVIDNADSCTINAVDFLKQSEVATVNTTGQLKVWDLRHNNSEPVKVFLPTGEQIPLHCLDKHPTQPHIVATGGQDGALSIWDMRQDKFPVTVLSAHSADTWDVKFHPSHPDHLFSCSQDGSVWHWDTSSIDSPGVAFPASSATFPTSKGDSAKSTTQYSSAWLASEASKHRMEITDLLSDNTMPVNCIDIENNTLLCGTDGEQIITVKDLIIR